MAATNHKVDMDQLREAVRKVFAYKPPAKKSDEPPLAKHRKKILKKAKSASKHDV